MIWHSYNIIFKIPILNRHVKCKGRVPRRKT